MEALAARRVQSSEDLLYPGDYVFIPKREPVVTVLTLPLEPPQGFWARLWWAAFGRKNDTKEIVEPRWPERDTIVLLCPECDSPCATTAHRIVSIEPLALDIPLTCPYCKTNTFDVKEGTITTAA